MSRLEARLRTLEDQLQEKKAGLIMPDGEIIWVPENTTMECMCEVTEAGREGRRPSHPYLDVVLKAKGYTGGGSIWQLVQVLYRCSEMYGSFAEHTEAEDEVKELQ